MTQLPRNTILGGDTTERQVFESVCDITMLAMVYNARANLEARRNHPQDTIALARTALRLSYVDPHRQTIATAHFNLADYLSRTDAGSPEQRAHRLAAALFFHLIGNIHQLSNTLRALASELRGDTDGPDVPALPTTLPEVVRLVDAGDGVRFGDLIAALCPDPETANQSLTHLLTTTATLFDQPTESTANPEQEP